MSFKVIREITPPFVRRVVARHLLKPKYGFFGNYENWDSASERCTGYDSEAILEKVKTAALKVKNGQAVFERDSVVHDKIQYSWPVLAGLMAAAAESKGRLSVVDFGGSLGSSFFQNRLFFQNLIEARWSIVEQHHFVKCGQELFQDETLRFYGDFRDCVEKESPDVLLLSGVLQYLENPYEKVEDFIKSGIEWIIVDRTPLLLHSADDRLTIQKIPPVIYDASYPCWILSRGKLLSAFSEAYRKIAEFEGFETSNVSDADFKGFVFKRHEIKDL